MMPNNTMTRQYDYSITKIVQKCQNSNKTRLRCLCHLSLCRLSLVSEIRTIPPTNCQNKQGMTEDHCNALGCILEPRDVQRWYVQILPSLSGSGIILEKMGQKTLWNNIRLWYEYMAELTDSPGQQNLCKNLVTLSHIHEVFCTPWLVTWCKTNTVVVLK